MTVSEYKKWLAQQIEFLRGLENWAYEDEPPAQVLEKARQIAIDLGLSECVAVCQPPATVGLLACLTDGKTVLTPPEIAEQLATAPETVVGWIKSGQLKGSNLSTGARPRYVVLPEDLTTFLTSRQPQPPAKRKTEVRRKYNRFSED